MWSAKTLALSFQAKATARIRTPKAPVTPLIAVERVAPRLLLDRVAPVLQLPVPDASG